MFKEKLSGTVLLYEIKWQLHYESKPIQIYRNFYHQKMEIFRQKSGIFQISAQNIECGPL